MMKPVIRCEGLSKTYAVGTRRQRINSLRDAIMNRLRSPLAAGKPETFQALDDVSAEFGEGEVVGLIGRNGAGKSTLLKILSRVTKPTRGVAEIRGRVGSLLEVGTGFHPELTGRENIFFNGAILGMQKREIERRFDEIVDFSGVEQFLDLPVKRYSSGMYVRLAFAVGAHLDTEVLLVDEVLAVGDAAFQKKCLGKMSTVAGGGRTVVFVSHNLNAVQRLCSRALLLERGRLIADGRTDDVIAQYLAEGGEGRTGEWLDLTQASRSGTGEARFSALRIESQPYTSEPLAVEIDIESRGARSVPQLAFSISDRYGTKLLNCDSLAVGEAADLREGTNRFTLRIEELHLNPGLYVAGLKLAMSHHASMDLIEHVTAIEVLERGEQLGTRPANDGVVATRYTWTQ